MEETPLSPSCKENISAGVRNELEEVNERLRRLLPRQKATLERVEAEELFKALLSSDYVQLWAQLKKEKYDALRRSGFTKEQALRLVD